MLNRLMRYIGFVGGLFMLNRLFQHDFLSVLYACVVYFCISTCSAQLNMFHMEKRSRNTLIIIIIKTNPLNSQLLKCMFV